MWHLLIKLVISCALACTVLVISRTGNVYAAVTSPVVTVLQPVTQGLRAPVRMVLDAEGNYYVTDPRNSGVIKFNQYGVPIKSIRTAGVPQGVAIAQDGKLLVSQGTFVAILNDDGSEAGMLPAVFKFANGIAVDDVTGYIYVVDSSAHQVLVFTASGAFVKSFGSRGTANGLFSMPTGITFEKLSRQLAVADTLNNKIQFFDMNGVYKSNFGPTSTVRFYFASPQGVAFEYSKDPVPVLSRMYVVDTYNANVQVINPAGNGAPLYIAGTNPLNNYIGKYGNMNGEMMVPSDVVFDQQNSRLMVVNGFGNITIFGIDGGTNPAENTPPTLAIDPVLANVSTPDITISGTVEATANITVATSTTAIASPVVFTSSTTWKCDIIGLEGGDNVITVTATSATGSSTQQSVSVRYTLPAPTITLSPSNIALTNKSNLVISGTVDAGSTVTVTNTATSITGNATVVDTTWTYSAALSEGANLFSIAAQKPMSDKAFASTEITLDSIAPALSVSALANGSYTSTQVQNIAGTVSDGGNVNLLINNQPVSISDSTFSSAVTLVTGPNVISIVAVDAAGNIAVDSRTIHFDSTQPVVHVAAPMDNSITNSTVITVNGSVDKTSTVMVSGVVAAMNGNEWTAEINLQAGLNTIEITATDLYGNSSAVKRSVVLDSVKPILAISSPSQDIATNNPVITISGTVSDNSDTVLMYSVDGMTAGVPITAGSFTFNLNLTKEGMYPVLLTVTDAAGNATSATRNIIYDITPPKLTIDTFKGVHPSAMTGTVEPGAAVVVKNIDISVGNVTVDSVNGTWAANLHGIAYKTKNLTIVATDVAGNNTVKTLAQAGTGKTR